MSNMELLELLRESVDTTPVEAAAIPELDLYMDQVLSLLGERFQTGSRTEGERTITKMMINNYSKERLLKRPAGKKYTREHIMLITLIYCLKQGLALEDVGRLLRSADGMLSAGEDRYDPVEVSALFHRFEEMKRSQERLTGEIVRDLEECGAGEGLFATVLYLVNLSGALSLAAGRLIDTLPDSERKKKPRRPEETAAGQPEAH
ncbi:MAG: DUF1836 domain-containing protein [Clostridiales bacterium]|nr:DUF1836 domain-containing protein [Clostridiales bacterium]